MVATQLPPPFLILIGFRGSHNLLQFYQAGFQLLHHGLHSGQFLLLPALTALQFFALFMGLDSLLFTTLRYLSSALNLLFHPFAAVTVVAALLLAAQEVLIITNVGEDPPTSHLQHPGRQA